MDRRPSHSRRLAGRLRGARIGVADRPATPANTDRRHADGARDATAGPATAPVSAALPQIDRPVRYGRLLDPVLRAVALAYLVVIVAGVVVYKAAFIQMLTIDPFFAVYGLLVSGYIVSRFVLSLFYRAGKDRGIEPHVAIVVPAFNEEAAIAQSVRSLLALDYPAEKLQIVAINDGSSDGTLRELNTVAAHADGRVEVIDFPVNRGKRAAMAAGIRATDAEIVAFVDSDSVLEPDAMRVLVQGFHDQKVGAICGHADVLNVRATWLTRMQAVRYFVAFKVIKAAESIFNAVTCCSGCFSAYRREAIVPHLDWWEKQMFLGVESTFGDDRSLTNCVLRGWKVTYESKAVSHTLVPETFHQFMKQQTRWKRSWTRESLIVATFIWRKHPIAAISTYISVVLPLLAPIAALRAIVWQPLMHGAGAPVVYILGIYAIALVYGLYFALRQRRYDTLWLSGILFVFFYLAFLLWQTYYAILTSRTRSWGTRGATPTEVAP
ncbi:MAG: hyaluronan synthase [Solirubrobacteraceae bacterium]|jgi:hyaluronan synthase|nr:hyaluronan synthase [Solirubrobacteraceae bacterium]